MPLYNEEGDEATREELLAESVVPIVDGTDGDSLTVEELLAGHQKGSAADSRLAEAAEKLKTAETQLKDYGTDIQAMKDLRQAAMSPNGDVDALRRGAKALGYDDTFVDQYLAKWETQNQEAGSEESKSGNGGATGTLSTEQATKFQRLDKLLGALDNLGIDEGEMFKILGRGVLAEGQKTVKSKLAELIGKNPKAARLSTDQVTALSGVAQRDLSGRITPGKTIPMEAVVSAANEAVELAGALNVGEGPSVGVGSGPALPSGSDYLPKKPAKFPSAVQGQDFEDAILHDLIDTHRKHVAEEGG